MKIVYIHGANSTSNSFNYIRNSVDVPHQLIDYCCTRGFEQNLNYMADQLKSESAIFFIAHSLGGIYALHLLKLLGNSVRGAVTISTPYGGSEIADFLKFIIPSSRLLRDIGPHSNPIIQSRNIQIQQPWINIVTVAGHSPWILGKNDGVVSVNSMQSRTDMETVQVKMNHHEVLQSPVVVELIKSRII
jgi:pimeloyl-ACP methyl ester carboxylesterase